MPFDTESVPSLLTKAARKRNLVPLIGAGISRLAAPAFPSWTTLLKEMNENALTRGWIRRPEKVDINKMLGKHQFLMAADALWKSYPRDEYEGFLKEKFGSTEVNHAPVHEAIFKLKSPLIMTTNYDTILENAYAAVYKRNALTWTARNAPDVANYLHSASPSSPPAIFKLHGSIHSADTIVLSERDYRELIFRQPGYRMVVSAIFVTKVVLMLGFSGDDPELRLVLTGMREALQHRSEPDYIFLEKGALNTVEKKQWREQYGLEVIEYDSTSGHSEVLEFVQHLTTFVTQGTETGVANFY